MAHATREAQGFDLVLFNHNATHDQLGTMVNLPLKMSSYLDIGGLFEKRYPNAPGYKAQDTAKAAAESMGRNAQNLRERVLLALQSYPQTADEVADLISKSVLAIRPRLSELLRMGKIQDSGWRRPNQSGKSAIVWKLK